MGFWDWKSGHQFQRLDSLVQPGSLESEAGIFCAEFDKTGLRLITGEADKTIKIWKEDDEAVSFFLVSPTVAYVSGPFKGTNDLISTIDFCYPLDP